MDIEKSRLETGVRNSADSASFPENSASETLSVPLTRGNVAVILVDRTCPRETGLVRWGAWIRTREWRNQNPLPYHLATPHRDACRSVPAHDGVGARNIAVHPRPINAAVARLWSIFAVIFA